MPVYTMARNTSDHFLYNNKQDADSKQNRSLAKTWLRSTLFSRNREEFGSLGTEDMHKRAECEDTQLQRNHKNLSKKSFIGIFADTDFDPFYPPMAV